VTFPVADRDWTRTQSWTRTGGGDVGETLGVGLGDGLGVDVGAGLDDSGPGDVEPGDGDALAEPLGEALGEPLDGDCDGVAVGVGTPPDTDGLALAFACWLRLAAALNATAVFGSVAHADFGVGAAAACAVVKAAATGPIPSAITAPSAPTAPGLMITPVTGWNLACTRQHELGRGLHPMCLTVLTDRLEVSRSTDGYASPKCH
jgi:hypothetical protein